MTRETRTFLPLVALMGFVCATGCESESLPDPRRHLLTQWVDGALLADYEELVARSQALATQSDRYCAQPSPEGWTKMQELWWAARAPWKRNEVFAFGPFTDNPWRLGAKIDFWPARPKTIEKTLATPELELTPETVANLGASATGMPALEYLLFRNQGTYQAPSPRECAYIVGLSHDLVKDSRRMVNAWSAQGENYRAQVLFADATTPDFEDLDDAMAEVVNRMGFTLENIRRDKLGAVLGNGPEDTHPQMVESRWSGRGIEDVRDNLRGLEKLVFGPKGRFVYEPLNFHRRDWSGFPTNLVQMLEYRGFYLYQPLLREFSACYAALDAIPAPLGKAASEAPQTVRAAIDALGKLQTLIQTQVLKNLALSITFNDADGD